ncbi:MAG: YlxR family protein [Tissierellaceae bacterium]
MKKRKIPLRKCVACNEHRPKKELIRVVKTSDGSIQMDLTGKLNGRGAYICPDMECLENAIQTKKISRSLEVEINDEVYEELRNLLREEIGKRENTFK